MNYGLQEKDTKTYLTILGSSGDFRMKVDQSTQGAQLRTYETSDGQRGEKYELVYKSVSGFIQAIDIFDGDYGKNLIVDIAFSKEKGVALSIGVATPFGEDLMKKLPNIDFSKSVTLAPYSFEDEKGKQRRGITVTQDGEKKFNAFYDPEKKENLFGFPEVEEDKDYDKEDWKMYFMQCRKFLVKYTEDNILSAVADGFQVADVPDEADNTQDLPGDDIAF